MPLQAVDNLFLYDPYFEGAALEHGAEVGGSSAQHPVRSWTEIVDAMQAFCLVKLLTFLTHGLPGLMLPPGGARIVGLDFAMANAGPTFLQKNARILFLGCNIAEGNGGDLFLDEIGTSLLRGKGGFVGATTVANMMFDFGRFSSATYMTPLSFGRLKVFRYDESGKRVAGQQTDRHGWKR